MYKFVYHEDGLYCQKYVGTILNIILLYILYYIGVRFPNADKSLADRRHIASLTPLSNTRGAAVAAVVGDYYCVIVSHDVTRIRQRYYSIVRMICDELTECAVQQLTVNFLICNFFVHKTGA